MRLLHHYDERTLDEAPIIRTKLIEIHRDSLSELENPPETSMHVSNSRSDFTRFAAGKLGECMLSHLIPAPRNP